ncbi:DUF4044 domain-containing protein [Aerococcaceae bacterium DSM 109652]|uniref:DUF4044 domain-containing protein n=2 Tax=Fundicoccus ignavus TaxID=2664442 RepID=A0A844C622_9LACT|nr:DUF4044 domain-containing protein [Fundicoccus ignavus]
MYLQNVLKELIMPQKLNKYSKKKKSKMEKIVKITAILMVIAMVSSLLISLAVSLNLFI